MSNPTKDDIYAYALSKTLTKISSPVTVGLYSSCQDRINRILEKVQVYTDKEAERIEKKSTVKPSASGFFGLIGRLLFFRPVWTKENQNQQNVRFIYVHFSAWHFAGSDLLWAGLAIRLVQAMQLHFGKLQLVLYRVAQYDQEDEVKTKIVEDSKNYWRSKKICCCPLWFLVLTIIVAPIIALILILTLGFPNAEAELDGTQEVPEEKGQVGVVEGMIIAAVGVPAASALRFIFQMVKNLIFSQEHTIKRGMDNERVSQKMGFMNEVRKEIWFLSRYIQFMEIFERRRIRVVLKITNLDRGPGYALLNHIVTLAFTLPPLSDDMKRDLFNSLKGNPESTDDRSGGKGRDRASDSKKTSFSDDSRVLIEMETKKTTAAQEGNEEEEEEEERLLGSNITTAKLDVDEEEVERKVENILTSETNINQYMLDDAMSMRRVINSVRVTVIIMKALGKDVPQPEYIAAWVVLANQWPCRLSWIIQCAEDAQQRADIDHNNVATTDDSKTLWKVFSESKAELYVMSAQIEDLLEQDGDPEMFERLLRKDFQFTIKDLKIFDGTTVNLDHSIRKELAQIRGTSRLKDSGWMRDLAPLPITKIINMKTEDVCNELERMKFPSKYIDKVRSNDLNGSALLFGNAKDLKELLDMTFGEWATFSLHFLGLPSHLQPQHKNMNMLEARQPQSLLRLKGHAFNQYSSNPNLLNSPM
ncbi:hypothetical protein INR49_016346 [Caranx melampygus]|nr:hypothetical protein INR49_016346 [Caranx melampygus]